MRKIAVANLKGGVGKTTTSIVLCDTLSAVAGRSVLALDLDSQANLSWALLAPSRFGSLTANDTITRWLTKLSHLESDAGLVEALVDVGLKPERGWRSIARSPETPARMHLAVSEPGMRFPEMVFEGPAHADPAVSLSSRLNDAIERLSANFEFCVMDCSPALSALTRAGLRIADAIILPTPLNELCLQSADTFRELGLGKILKVEKDLFVLPTRVSAHSGKHEAASVRQRLRAGEEQGKWRVLDPEFPECVEYMRAVNPPALGPHETLRDRYRGRRSDLKRFLESLTDKGIVR